LGKNNHESKLKLKATPEDEDFRGKYESGKIGDRLLDKYFDAVKKLVEITDVTSEKAKAIEIGCGEGLSTKRLSNFMPKNVTLEASEYVEHQIPFAKQNTGLKVTQESVYELKHKDKTFDMVFLLEVLEHLDYPDKGLEELKRVTKDKGYIIIGVPNEPLWRALNMARGKYLREFGNTTGHLNHWSTAGLIKFVEKHFGPVVAKKTPLPWTIVLAKKDEKTNS